MQDGTTLLVSKRHYALAPGMRSLNKKSHLIMNILMPNINNYKKHINDFSYMLKKYKVTICCENKYIVSKAIINVHWPWVTYILTLKRMLIRGERVKIMKEVSYCIYGVLTQFSKVITKSYKSKQQKTNIWGQIIGELGTYRGNLLDLRGILYFEFSDILLWDEFFRFGG